MIKKISRTQQELAIYYLLTYQYVANILTEREPYRANHLARLKNYQERGKLLLAGATGDPITGACFAFKLESASMVQQFVDQDPYVKNGLVTDYVIQPWTVVIGSAHDDK